MDMVQEVAFCCRALRHWLVPWAFYATWRASAAYHHQGHTSAEEVKTAFHRLGRGLSKNRQKP